MDYLIAVFQRFPPFRQKVRAGRLLAWVLSKIGVAPVRTVTLRDGSRMLLDARGRTEAEAVWNGSFDVHTAAVLRACAPPGAVVLDVGANVGLVAIPLARYLQATGGKVIAFEPVAANAARIAHSGRASAVDVVIHEVALSDAPGTITMHRDAALGAATGNAIMGSAGAGYGDESVAEVRTLDSYSGDIVRVDLMKVDIEGAEVGFLKGSDQIIRRDRPLILGEFNSVLMPRFGTTFMDIAPMLKEWDYRVVAWRDFADPEVVEPRVGLGNALLVPVERLEAVLERLRDHIVDPYS